MYLIFNLHRWLEKRISISQILVALITFTFIVTTSLSLPAIGKKQNYAEALQKSILFFEAQQAGKLPKWNRFPWRGDSTLDDGADVGVDLSGGWVDAGDNVKFGFPTAFSVTNLAWGGIEYYDAFKESGQLEHLSQNIKWATDYLVSSFANDNPGEYVLYGQVGDGNKDHQWWGPLEVVHYQMERPAYKIDTSCPGTELAGETAAALASSSILFRQLGDRQYADLLVDKAEKLFDFANNYRGKYSDCLQAAVPFYTSVSGYQDELVWGATWLHKAKSAQNDSYDGKYLAIAEAEYETMTKPFDYTYQFDDKTYGVYVLLAKETGKTEYQQRAEAWLDFWTIGHQGKRITYTPGGLAYLVKWGSLPLSANTSFVAFVYSDWLESRGEKNKAERYFDFAVSQIDYILGQNPSRRSYIIGYGENYPRNPHHRTAHGSWLDDMSRPKDNRNLLIGALVGGPDEYDNWEDDRSDWVRNEVAIGYNATLVGALAKMYAEFGGEPLTEITFPEPNDEPEIYVESRIVAANKETSKIDLTIINRSTTPARGLENPTLRVLYRPGSRSAQVSATAISQDCPNTPSQAIEVKPGLSYAEVVCQGTVIYPGGEEKYKKQITLKLDSNRANGGLFSWLSKIFAKPLEITRISLFSQDELVWESDL